MTATMIPTTPPRTIEQRLKALANANRIRSHRAGLKRDVKAGRTDPLKQLLDPPAELGTMKVCDLLLAVPKVGRVKVNRALVMCRISPSKTLGGMTDRQRRELARVLPLGAAGRVFDRGECER
jgi:hypothetical protein